MPMRLGGNGECFLCKCLTGGRKELAENTFINRGEESMSWFVENAGTIVISLVLILVVAGIIRSIVNDKKQGKSSCGGSCGCCPMGGACHKKQMTQ